MLLGLSIEAFTLMHVIISLIGIATGLIWLLAAVGGRWLGPMNAVFLVTTIATTVTGFMFPITAFSPALGVGGVSLAVLAVAAAAHFRRWPVTYIVTAAIALYLNCFVAVVQAFLKIGPLNSLAPTGSEPPFALVQGALFLAFVAMGWLSARRRPLPA
ncbi:hypothetical protein [Niveispirillum cyanobacteriorum]|uniref:Uncharacterized protein n=1 Tax=Niveispirillum cyanobacteriorum TaxID=1612173 RepID=A0A2K9NI37_9PROT|nr:hypothetical protein [Niveispirillum cyanobacteriorum]AUN32752.1 hypothetical protein C0V82_20810 [Niveispirillum cyanobacteriorum]GGE83917.1 hypothetical protein GCM10011317_46440 [Niveispirillum cyanobacteriorum]